MVISENSPVTAPPLIFSIPEYDYLRLSLCSDNPDLQAGEVARKHFPDGELYQRLLTSVEQRDVVLVGGTISAAATLQLYDLACALVTSRARRLTLLIPYFGYQTMDRALLPGEVVAAKTRARLLSHIPPADAGNRVLLFDLHNEGIQHYFEGSLVPVHVLGISQVAETIESLGYTGRLVIGSADAGRAKWVQALANRLGVDAAFVYKRRVDGNTTEVVAMSEVRADTVVIYDDILRTGSSLAGAAQAYRTAGAKNLVVIVTHGVFAPGSVQLLREAGVAEIICTNSHPRALEMTSMGVRVIPIEPLLRPMLCC